MKLIYAATFGKGKTKKEANNWIRSAMKIASISFWMNSTSFSSSKYLEYIMHASQLFEP